MNRSVFFGLTGWVVAACVGLSAVPAPVVAQTRLGPEHRLPPVFQPVDADRIVATMQVDLLADVLAAEIAEAGDPFAPDRDAEAGVDEGWAAIVARIAPPARIRVGLHKGIAQSVAGLTDPAERSAVAEALGFWESDLGRRVVLLEIGARQAMSSPGIETAARDAFAAAAARNHPRAGQVRALIEAGDLIEPAVAASLNIAMATLRGAQEAAGTMDSSIIEDAWLQEPEIRADQSGWIEALVFMASAPLSDAEMARLIEASGHRGNRRLGTMLNEAASATFVEIARDLGRASVQRQLGERL